MSQHTYTSIFLSGVQINIKVNTSTQLTLETLSSKQLLTCEQANVALPTGSGQLQARIFQKII